MLLGRPLLPRCWLLTLMMGNDCVSVVQLQDQLLDMATMAQSRVVRYVFNYNTLESVSITISTSILLCGMIFSSGALTQGSWGSWLLTVFVAGVISLSILVMIILILFESFRAVRYSNLYRSLT